MFVVVIQLLSHVWLFVTPLTAAHQAFLFFTISWNLLKFMSIESVIPSNCLILCHLLSQHHGLFQWVSSLNQVAKVLELQLQHQSFQWIFKVDWLVWLPCSPRDSQESTPTLQFESIILQCLAFFMVQLSCPHMTTGKTSFNSTDFGQQSDSTAF